MTQRPLIFLTLLSCFLLMGGCAHQPKPLAIEESNAVSAPSLNTRPFEKQTLFDLMLGELASKQGRMDLLLDQYVKQARYTKDPGIIERALQIALYLKKYEVSAEMAQLWLNLKSEDRQTANYAFFYLAQIAQAKKDQESALTLYRKVQTGPFFHAAQLQSAALLADQGKLNEARTLLTSIRQQDPSVAADFFAAEANLLIQNKHFTEADALLTTALAQFPNHPELLYSHSIIAEKQQRWEVMEQDLRRIIKLYPDNAVALNALGYTLADRNQHLKEAQAFIQRAYQLNPNDPATMDSLGWVEYRLGHYTEAQAWLEKAYQLWPDAEIAAHLGEVLWKNNQREQAITIWKAALKTNPQDDTLQKTLQQFHVDTTTP